MRLLLFAVFACMPTLVNAAAGAYTAEIQDVWVMTKDGPTALAGKAEIVMKGAPIQLAGCAPNSLLFNIKSSDDPGGPGILATVLSAKLAGKPIQVNVMNDVLIEGRCTLRYLGISG